MQVSNKLMLRDSLKLKYNGAYERMYIQDWIKTDPAFMLQQLELGNIQLVKNAHQLLMQTLYDTDPSLYEKYQDKKRKAVAIKKAKKKFGSISVVQKN